VPDPPGCARLFGLERLPYRATTQASAYQRIVKLPVAILLDNVRSLYNVGSFFRTADGAGAEQILLCGITGRPPEKAISKTTLGAENSVAWSHHQDAAPLLAALRARNYELAAIETTPTAVDLFDWRPNFPVCVLFGHEVEGLNPELSALADTHVRIPMLGVKHSLNVATAGGVVIYELLRKYRRMHESAPATGGF